MSAFAVPMTIAALHALYPVCAPNVAPETLDALITAESGANPYNVNINGPITARKTPASPAEALLVAQAGLRAGYTVDVGLLQVNSGNLRALGVTLEQLLDPCTNLRAGSQVLRAYYEQAVRVHGEGQAALRAALSAYNTGDLKAGFANGYVTRVVRQAAGRSVPRISGQAPRPAAAPTPYTAPTAVFTSSTPREGTTDGTADHP